MIIVLVKYSTLEATTISLIFKCNSLFSYLLTPPLVPALITTSGLYLAIADYKHNAAGSVLTDCTL